MRTLGQALAARGHEVAVATLWHAGHPEQELDGDVRIYRLRGTLQRMEWLFSESGRRHVPPVPDPELVLALRRVIQKERPEIVHAHNWMIHSFLPLKSWSKAPLVLTLHDYSFRCAKKRLMYHDAPCSGPGMIKCLRCGTAHYGMAKGIPTVGGTWLMHLAERALVDRFIAVSTATAVGNGLIDSGLSWQVIPNFVPDDISDRHYDAGEHSGELPEQGYLLYVGDLAQDKGIEVLLQTYAQLQNVPPLVLIGRRVADTPDTVPPHVHMVGTWKHDAVMAAWQGSTLALTPSLVPETFGIVALEAMAMGRPVIASRIGGLPDVVDDGTTGLLVPPGDTQALQHAIEQLLANPELRKHMGEAARRRSAEFHTSRIVPRIEQVYEELIRQHVSTSPSPSKK